MKKIISKLMGGVLLFSLSMSLTSCEGALDDILGEWSRPTPGSSTGGGSDSGTVTAVTITTAPTATTGDILDGSTTALVTAGVADGGTVMYKATSDTEPKPTTTDGFSAEIPTAAGLAVGTYFVWYYAKAADAQHSDSEIAATPVKVTVLPTLSTPLTVEAITAGTIKVAGPKAGMQYSLNGGAKKAVTTTPIDVAAGGKVAFYGQGITITQYAGTQIGGTAQVKVYGNIMSLVDEENFATNYNTLPAISTFIELFKDNAKLTDASGLLLPATTLKASCYWGMFSGCTGLTTVPEKLLPATTLAIQCYQNMFSGCTGLTTVPEKLLPATTLANHCYRSMFENCTGLTTLPEKLLPATEMKSNCYSSMFNQCTGLTTLPEKLLPATVMATNCYAYMFKGCTSLTTAPALPATNLTNRCYQNMFDGCNKLTTAPALPATTLADYCYSYMFNGCEKLEQTPHLAAPTSELKKQCYYYMFAECKGLTKAYVKANYTDDSGVDQCEGMFNNCTDATTSTFYSADADNYKSQFSLNSWQTAPYE